VKIVKNERDPPLFTSKQLIKAVLTVILVYFSSIKVVLFATFRYILYHCFTDDLKQMFEKAGLVEKQNLIDRRLQVNRGRQLKMYRVWIQCKYSKPIS
jgi:hypothetical protein